MYRTIPIVILFLSVSSWGAQEQKQVRFVEDAFSEYCYECHDSLMREADLAIDTLDMEHPAADAKTWEKVIHKLRHRQMPPQGEPRPAETTYQDIVQYLASAIDRSAAMDPKPGRTDTFRRLTRFEYQNAIRDLLALEVEVDSLLPKDSASHGFDNVTVAELSPTLLERYLAAAKKISALAVGSPVPVPQTETFKVPPDLTQEHHLEGMPLGTRGGAGFQHHFPRDAEYTLQVRLMRDRNEEVEGLRGRYEVFLLLDDELIKTFEVKRPEDGLSHDHVDRHMNARIPVKAGPHRITATFVRKSSALLESELQPTLAHFNMDRHPRNKPAIYSITVVGPYESAGPGSTPSRRRIFTCYPDDPNEENACAEEIISNLLRRAWRRPISKEDLQVPLQFYQQTKEQEGFEAGIEMALRAILVNPQFLFRIERDPADVASGEAYQISDIELASRLSFFLWSSIPDEELLQTAIDGRLSDSKELKRQVLRMLRDPRSEALVKNFASQWLYLRNLDSTSPNLRLFLDFDDNLRDSMRRETELFFQSVVRENRSVLDLLRAEYTFVNERLAQHYNLPHITGSRFRRVALKETPARGGLLTQGSILTVTSYANRTSPVVRGVWILENILGAPPEPPPPDVPQLEEKEAFEEPVSLRDRIAAHRANKACARCHDLIDPVGFALENYDAIGRFRVTDDSVPVDASGEFSDGTTFEGAAELQQAILKRPELFVSTVTEKLLTYALGRGVEYYDAPAVRGIVEQAAQEEYRFESLILSIVQSTPFQMRKAL